MQRPIAIELHHRDIAFTKIQILGKVPKIVQRVVFLHEDSLTGFEHSLGFIEAEANGFGADPYLLAGLIRQESSFTPDAMSRAGAQGLMQLMPPTAAGLARQLGVDWGQQLVVVPDANLHLGVAHLTALLRSYDDQLAPAIAAYNAGGRPVSRWLRYPEASDAFLWVERIPYVETRGYVRTVLRNRELYRALYPSGN